MMSQADILRSLNLENSNMNQTLNYSGENKGGRLTNVSNNYTKMFTAGVNRE